MRQDMTQGSIVKVLAAFTLPLILSGLLQQMFNWVDAFIVGNIEGESALGGIGAVTSVYNLFVTVIVGFTSGVSVLAAQRQGMGKTAQLKEILSTFTILLGGAFLIIAIIGAPLTGTLLTLLGTPADIFNIGKRYMQILFIGVPFLAIYNTYSAVLRGIGDSGASFLSVVVCSGFNIILDLVFVVGLQYGAAGAAIATVISQALMTLFVVVYTIKKYPALRYRLTKNIICGSYITAGVKYSLPPAIQSGTSSLGNLALQRFMNGFGKRTVAAITTAYRVDSVILLPVVNFGAGVATVTAQNIGAGFPERAKKVLKTGAIMITILSFCLTGTVILAGEFLISIFGLTAKSVEIGTSFFHTIAACYVVFGLAMALRGYLEGTGDMLFSGVTGIVSLCVRIAASYAFADRFGNMVIGYAEAFSWLIMLAIYFIRFLVAGKTNHFSK